MQLFLSSSRNSDLLPSAAELLRRIPPEYLYFEHHRLRHPNAIYYLSLEKICAALLRIKKEYLAKLEEYRYSNGPGVDISELLHHQEGLLRVMQEHIDDCYLILKILIDPKLAKKTPLFAEKYVLENKLSGAKGFQQSIESYKKSLTIANKLKHQQGRLQGVLVTPGPHLGYYLEAPSIEGALGTCPDIHPDQGCFSFIRDISWHVMNLYLCSESLCRAIRKTATSLLPLDEKVPRDRQIFEWNEVLRFMADLQHIVFPNERHKGLATFRLGQAVDMLTIKFPDKNVNTLSGSVHLSMKITRDGYSDKILPPLIM